MCPFDKLLAADLEFSVTTFVCSFCEGFMDISDVCHCGLFIISKEEASMKYNTILGLKVLEVASSFSPHLSAQRKWQVHHRRQKLTKVTNPLAICVYIICLEE